MKNLIQFAVVVLLASVGHLSAQTESAQVAKALPRPFVVFDNMFYIGKPSLSDAGLVPCSVIYSQGEIDESIAAGRLPDEASFKADVRQHVVGRPGPVVIDIEYVYLSKMRGTTDAQVRAHFNLYITLARWAHEAAPQHLVGYYGHGLFPEEPGKEYASETSQLIAAIDAFFPSMYVYGNQTRTQWTEKLQGLLQQAHELAADKPVYPYLWPQYHGGSPRALEFVEADYMKYQLETARSCGAEGVVMWGTSHAGWADRPWLHALLDFVANKPVQTGHRKFNRLHPGTLLPE